MRVQPAKSILIESRRLERDQRWPRQETGNAALIEVDKVLEESFRQSDILGRLGGDEFAVFISYADQYEIGGIGRRIQRHLDNHNAASSRMGLQE